MEIRTFTERDFPEIMELKDSLGWNQTERDLQRMLELEPEGCFEAVLDGRLAGTSVALGFGETALVALVMVAESMRGRGIGRALMEHTLSWCRRRGLVRVQLDATDQGLPLYRACGFVAGWRISLARGLPAGGLPPRLPVDRDDAREAVRRIGPDEAAGTAALDREAGGVDREAFIRRLAAEFPLYGFGLRRGRGTVLFRPGRHSWTVGPLAAETREGAGLLLRAALEEIRSAGAQRPVMLSVPDGTPWAAELADGWGFEVVPRLTRMLLGAPPPAPSPLLHVLSGPEKG